MSVDLELAPKHKRAAGQACCEPLVFPEVSAERAARLAEVAKALGDPIRLQLLDVLRLHAGKVCVCELQPLFEVSQPPLSHHLRRLRMRDWSTSSAEACGPTTTSCPTRSTSSPNGWRDERS